MAQRTFFVPRAVGPLQVELPEFKTKGRKGALHIRPSSTLFLSEDEVKFLKESKPVLFSKLRETTPKREVANQSTAFFGYHVGDSSDNEKKSASTGRKKDKSSE